MTALFGVLLVASMSSAVTPVTAGADPAPAPDAPAEPVATWSNLGWSADPESAGALSGGADAWGTVEVDWQASADAVTGESFTLGLPSRIRGDDRDPLEVQLATDDGYLGATGTWSTERDELTVELEQDGLPDGEDSTEPLGGTLSFDVVWSEAAAASTTSGVRDLRFIGPGLDGADNKKAATLQAQYVAPELEAATATETSSASTAPKTPATPSVTETTAESPDAGTSADTDSAETSDTEDQPRLTGLVARGSASATADGESDPTESLPSRDRPAAEVDPESEESEQLTGAFGMFSTLAAAGTPIPGVNMPIASSTGATPWDLVTPEPAANPGFPDACGMDATVVIDTSGSMSSADIANAKASASLLADVLEGTRSTVRIVPFAAGSPSGGNASVSMARMSVNTEQAAIQTNIDKVRRTGLLGGDGTFYHRAFEQVLNDPGDVVMFLTDGGHRTAKPNYDFTTNTQRNRFTEWIVPANAVKNSGARIIPVGVGNDFETSKPSSQNKAWAPPFWWMARGADNLSVQGRDYYAVASSDELGSILSDAATQGCVGSLNLTSKERLRNGNEVNLGGFSYGVSGAGFETTPAGTVTTDSGGEASIMITQGSGTATVTQSPRSPYNIYSVACENNLTGANIPATISGNSFTLPLSDLSFVSCTVVNDKPVVNGAIEWTKVDSNTGELLGGSSWRLSSVVGALITHTPVSDCIADDASACTGPDIDPAAGKFFVDDLPPGMYMLTEGVAPVDYILGNTPSLYNLKEGEVHSFGAIENRSVFGGVAFTKVDSANDAVLPGSVWSITPITSEGTPTGPAVRVEDCVAASAAECTGPDLDPRGGEFYLDGLREGDYRVQEIESPFGYIQQENPIDLTIVGSEILGQEDGTTVVRLPNTKQPVGTLAFNKVDADDGTTLLPDSEWELLRVNGEGEPFGEAVSFQDCVAASAAGCTGLDKNPTAGEFFIDVPYGDYALRETLAPLGYRILDHPVAVNINGATVIDPIENELLGSGLMWSKVAEADPTLMLGGSQWELTQVEDEQGVPTGVSIIVDDCTEPECVVPAGSYGDQDPREGFFWVELPNGKYTLTEETAPEGYELDRTVHQVEITDAPFMLGAIENGPEIPRGDLFFSKVDADDDEIRLAGSEWELTELDSAGAPTGPVLRIEDCVEGSAAECVGLDRDPRVGEFLITGLPQGEYSLTEVVAPVGYALPDVSGGVIEIGDEPVGGPIPNEKQPVPNSLTWTKVSSSDTSELLAGSEWELTKLDSSGNPDGPALVVVDCVAASEEECGGQDKDPRAGGFSVSGLTLTEYSLVETKAPAGYVLDDSPHVQLVSGETSMGPIENVQQDGLVIPLTGGLGAEKFLWGGAALAALVALMLALRHRVQRAALVRGDQA